MLNAKPYRHKQHTEAKSGSELHMVTQPWEKEKATGHKTQHNEMHHINSGVF